MTSQPASDGLFESFRRAEMLIARSRPLDALQALLPVLADSPDDVSVQLLAGRAYLNSAQLKRAEEAFSRVLDLDPADHYARFALGKALQRQGRLAEALTQLKMAAAMDPRPEYQEALGEVRTRLATEPTPGG
ncbi:MAG: tetratricopeptide repeat protein [Pseudonocardia sp.]